MLGVVADDSKTPKTKTPSRVGVRIRPGSVVDVVDLPELQVRAGEVVQLTKTQADAALAASRVLERAEGSD